MEVTVRGVCKTHQQIERGALFLAVQLSTLSMAVETTVSSSWMVLYIRNWNYV